MLHHFTQPMIRPMQKIIVVKFTRNCNEETLFIAMPFSDDFDSLLTAIQKAAIYTHLRPIRTDKTPSDADFIKDIQSSIRNARLVAAVCTPPSGSSSANPNVMYELGFAHSIGKSSLILTTDIDVVPSDLRTRNVVGYKRGDECTEGFVHKLAFFINTCKELTPNGITDMSYEPDISCSAALPITQDPIQWNSILTILDFSKNIHHHFQALDAGHIENLLRSVEKILTEPDAPNIRDQQTFCRIAWDSYCIQFDRIWSFNIEPLVRHLDVIASAFKLLLQTPRDASAPRDILFRSAGFFQELLAHLQKYPVIHNDIKLYVASPPYYMNLHTLLSDANGTTQLAGQLASLSSSSKNVVNLADSLIRNLVNAMHYGFEPEAKNGLS